MTVINYNITDLLTAFFADGSEIALLKDNLIYAELDKDLLIDFRTKFPFLADQDNFSISI